MVVMGKVVEPTAASATSTYPAVITYVDNEALASTDTGLIKLSFYCPSTMNGEPIESSSMGNNVVDAPIRPHNGAEKYDYQIGGVIVISYADGNLSTPQFVRYVSVSEDVIEYNKAIVYDGASISVDDSVDLNYADWDLGILNNYRLVKAVTLLPIMKQCASGNEGTNFINEFTLGDANPFQDISYTKVGPYGTEFICEDYKIGTKYNWDYTDKYKDGCKVKTSHKFINICKYLTDPTNEILTITPTSIIDVFKTTFNIPTEQIIKSHPLATYCFVVLSGLPSNVSKFNTTSKILYPNAEEDNGYNDKLIITTEDQQNYNVVERQISEIYRNADGDSKTKELWKNFVATYKNELDKCYTIILNNNLQKIVLSQAINDTWDNFMLVLLACIATAYPLLEYTITDGTGYITNFEKNSENYNFMETVIGYAKKKKDITFYGEDIVDYISEGFSKVYTTLITWGSHKNSKQKEKLESDIKNNIKIAANSLLDKWDTYYQKILIQDVTDLNFNSSTITQSTYDNINNNSLINPFPNYICVSSNFGYREFYNSTQGKYIKNNEHRGIDLAGNGGQPILAAQSGTVTYVYTGSTYKDGKGYGNYIIIDHGNGMTTLYAHLSSVISDIEKGKIVKQGQVIGFCGSTGNSTGNHLHFEIRINNNPENPRNYITWTK